MDVGAALAFEQESEPEGERGGKRWVERCGWALVDVLVRTVLVERTPRCSSYEWFEAGVLARSGTHTQEVEGFEALARNDGDQLHFAEEADFVGREPGGEREGHASVVCYGIACAVLEYEVALQFLMYNGGLEVGRACPAVDRVSTKLRRLKWCLGDIRPNVVYSSFFTPTLQCAHYSRAHCWILHLRFDRPSVWSHAIAMASFFSRSYILLGLPLAWWSRSVEQTVPEPYLVCLLPSQHR